MGANAADTAGPSAGRREWIGLVVLALPTLLLSLDFSVIYLAVPDLSVDLGADSTQQLWIADIYGFMMAGFLVTMGTVGDRIGRRKLLLIGAVLFGVASILAAFSTSAGMLIAARALMGVSGATLMPSTLALISTMFKNPRQMGVAIAAWMACFMGGMALGPVVGGVLLDSFWWGSVFLLGVPVMVVLLAVGPVLLPESRDPDPGKLDLVSVALSLLAVLPFVYGLKELLKAGFDGLPVVSLVLGAVFAVAFVSRQRKLADPLMDLSLFRDRAFSTALLVGSMIPALQGGTYFLIAQHLQDVEGLSPISAGLWLAPSSAIMIGTILVAPVLARRVRPAYLFCVGLLTAAAGFVVLTRIDGPGQLLELWIGYAIMALGVGLPAGLGTALVLGAAPQEKAGSASAVSEAGNDLGVAMGVAVLGSVCTLVYRGEFAGQVPGGLPPSATAAADNLAAAVPVAGQLPSPQGPELLAAARAAFTTGLNTVAIICSALFVALAVLSAVALRHVPATGTEATDTEPADTAAEQSSRQQ
ncbi:MFS transporter [Amycolatopsis sp. cmx-11-51]|uniref:MFS transporter n=1 Tax=unclassified Amycolatopsis TaxID=2618356 RepID=UPI0039E4BADB